MPASPPRPVFGIECGGHDEEGQVVSQVDQFAQHRERQVGLEAALVHLVQHDRVDTGELRIVQPPAQDHPGRRELDLRVPARAAVAAHGVADGPAHFLARQVRQPVGRGAGRDPAGLRDEDAGAGAWGLGSGGLWCKRHGESGRDDGRLPRPRQGLDDRTQSALRRREHSDAIHQASRRQPGADPVEVEDGVSRSRASVCHSARTPRTEVPCERECSLRVGLLCEQACSANGRFRANGRVSVPGPRLSACASFDSSTEDAPTYGVVEGDLPELGDDGSVDTSGLSIAVLDSDPFFTPHSRRGSASRTTT